MSVFQSLTKRLEVWRNAGLLSPEQAVAIAEFEKSQSHSWSLYGLTGIGVVTIATGIISLIAANWESLTPSIKIGVYLLLQGGLGYWAARQLPRPGFWREAALFLFSAGFMAGIGLVAQIYHLGGSGWRALAFWLFLTAPIVVHAEGRLLNHAWVLTLLGTVVMWAVGLSRHSGINEAMRASIVVSTPLLLTALGFFTERFFAMPRTLREAILTWGLAVTLVAGTVMGNVMWHAGRHRDLNELTPYLWLPWCSLLLASAASYLRGAKISRALRVTTAVTLLVWGIYLTLPILLIRPDESETLLRKCIGAGGFIVVGLLGSAAAALGGYRKLYDLATLAVSFRLLMVYFEVFGNMAQTGLGLIVTGVLFLGMARLWQKHRRSFLKKLEGQR